MKKIVCSKCGLKRGRRQCIKYNKKYICGDCCSSIQLSSGCPVDCIHNGKLKINDLNHKVEEFIEMGILMRNSNPNEAVRLFDKALKLDENNSRGLVEKSRALRSLVMEDDALECLKKAYTMSEDPDICMEMALIYRRKNRFNVL
jgi:tetratricopeptide (TPR) repeat protein